MEVFGGFFIYYCLVISYYIIVINFIVVKKLEVEGLSVEELKVVFFF